MNIFSMWKISENDSEIKLIISKNDSMLICIKKLLNN